MSGQTDILAIDDDKISQKVIDRALKPLGYNTRPASWEN